MKKGLLITAFGVFTLFSSIGQQIGNSDMEGWDNLGTSNEEPTNWNSFKSGTGSLVGFASQQVQRSTAVRPATQGGRSEECRISPIYPTGIFSPRS